MNKQYTNNLALYYNNHCTESAVEFIADSTLHVCDMLPHICDAQCLHDCDDCGQAEYDTLDAWIEDAIDIDYNWTSGEWTA